MGDKDIKDCKDAKDNKDNKDKAELEVGPSPRQQRCQAILRHQNHPWGRVAALSSRTERVVADRTKKGPWETFLMVEGEAGVATFMADDGYFLRAENGGGGKVVADHCVSGEEERFRFAARGKGKVSLQAPKGQYIQAENGGGGDLKATSPAVGAYETFTLD